MKVRALTGLQADRIFIHHSRKSIVDSRFGSFVLTFPSRFARTGRPTEPEARPGGPVTQTADPNAQPTAYAEGFSHEPLRLRVATVLREAILSGSLLPGAPLIEKTIAEDLEISRAPVREAIRTLAKEGLVESIPYKGSRVRVLYARDVHEVYSMRGLLERYAVRQVLAAHPAVDLAPLETACVAMEAAAAAGDARALTDADERFHEALIALPDHELLLGMWNLIELRARHAMALRNVQMGDLGAVAANHRAIVATLRAGDLDGTLRLVTEHVESGAQLILDDWERA
jgi:DNA-binding GntR family transcriptional regulator